MNIIRYLLVFCSILLLPQSLFAAPGGKGVIVDYIEQYKDVAAQLSEEYGIPMSIILGVAIVESSAGKGPAVKNLNNHFGIVGHNHLEVKGKHKSRYKEYTCAEESFRDFCRVLSHKKYYQRLRCTMDSKKWVLAMSRAHYSEVPEIWKKKILTAIHLYDLDSYNKDPYFPFASK